MPGIEELFYQDRATVRKARRLQRFLTQPFIVSQLFTGQSGKFVLLPLTIESCKRIVAGELSTFAKNQTT